MVQAGWVVDTEQESEQLVLEFGDAGQKVREL